MGVSMILTAKQRRFVTEYVKCLNGTQAAIAAGYSPKTARVIASENLRKPSIQAEIANQEALRQTRLNAAQERVIRELVKIVDFDISRLFNGHGAVLPMSQWPPEATSIVAAFKYGPIPGKNGHMRANLKFNDRFKVWVLLAEITGAISRRKNAKRRPSK